MPRFKKGQSGNPKGAPKRNWSWSGELQKAVEEAVATGQPVKELVAKSLVREALKGDVHAINSMMNRMDGMPPQATDITSQGEKIENIDINTLLEKAYGKQNEDSTGEVSKDS